MFATFIHETAEGLEYMYVSAGKVGFQIMIEPKDLVDAVPVCSFADRE